MMQDFTYVSAHSSGMTANIMTILQKQLVVQFALRCAKSNERSASQKYSAVNTVELQLLKLFIMPMKEQFIGSRISIFCG